MNKSASSMFIAVSGYPESMKSFFVLSNIAAAYEKKSPSAQLMQYCAGTWKDCGRYRWDGVGLAMDNSNILLLGRNGEVASCSLTGNKKQESSIPGYPSVGPMRGVREIGEDIFAYGMRRQLYRRRGENHWVPWMRGFPNIAEGSFLHSKEYRLDVIRAGVGGITAVSGSSIEDMYAVGFNGELWGNDGTRWRVIDSPTNLNLYDSVLGDDNYIYVCGQGGTLLKGIGDKWQLISYEGAGKIDFYSIQYFNGKIFLSDGQSLMLLDGGNLSVIDMGVGCMVPSHEITLNNGVLFSVAGKELFYSNDGVVWSSLW